MAAWSAWRKGLCGRPNRSGARRMAKFALKSRAFVLASPAGAAASDWSAVAIHRLPAMSPPPLVPSVIRLGSRSSDSNRTCHGRTRFAHVPERWLGEVDGAAVVSRAFAAVDVARRCDSVAALALADAVARRDRTNGRMLQAWQDCATGRPSTERGRLRSAMPMQRVRSRVQVVSPLSARDCPCHCRILGSGSWGQGFG